MHLTFHFPQKHQIMASLANTSFPIKRFPLIMESIKNHSTFLGASSRQSTAALHLSLHPTTSRQDSLDLVLEVSGFSNLQVGTTQVRKGELPDGWYWKFKSRARSRGEKKAPRSASLLRTTTTTSYTMRSLLNNNEISIASHACHRRRRGCSRPDHSCEGCCGSFGWTRLEGRVPRGSARIERPRRRTPTKPPIATSSLR
jgi:hypothetical protein